MEDGLGSYEWATTPINRQAKCTPGGEEVFYSSTTQIDTLSHYKIGDLDSFRITKCRIQFLRTAHRLMRNEQFQRFPRKMPELLMKAFCQNTQKMLQ